MDTFVEKFVRSPTGLRVFHQERSVLEVTELICELMQQIGVSRTELARRLNKTKGYITQLLDGEANMTVKTMSDVFFALGRAIHFYHGPVSISSEAQAVKNVSVNLRLPVPAYPAGSIPVWITGTQSASVPCVP